MGVGPRDIAGAVRREHRLIGASPLGKVVRSSIVRISGETKNGRDFAAAFDPNPVEFEPGELRCPSDDAFGCDNVDVVEFGDAFEPCGEIYGVAEDGIVEPAQRSHITDAAGSRIQPDPDHGWSEGLAQLGCGLLACRIEDGKLAPHSQSGGDSFGGVIRHIERRVPERDDGVADIFVDRAFVIENRIGHRRQERIHEPRQFLRIESFRKAGEVS
jgi:hypothetical protein